MIDIDELDRINRAGDRYGHITPGKVAELIAEVRRLREDANDWKRRWQDAVDHASEAITERNHWQANHDNQVARARFLIERGDIPVERVRAYEEMGALRIDAERWQTYMRLFTAEAGQETADTLVLAIDAARKEPACKPARDADLYDVGLAAERGIDYKWINLTGEER